MLLLFVFLIKTYLYIPLSNHPLPLSLPPNPLLVCHQELPLSDQQTHLYLRTLLRVLPTPIYLSWNPRWLCARFLSHSSGSSGRIMVLLVAIAASRQLFLCALMRTNETQNTQHNKPNSFEAHASLPPSPLPCHLLSFFEVLRAWFTVIVSCDQCHWAE